MQSLIAQLGKWSPKRSRKAKAELDALLSELIPRFLRADPETRSQTRGAIAGVAEVETGLRSYTHRVANSISLDPRSDQEVSGNDDRFRLGLGALAIENGADYRESMTALAELCIRAEKAGVPTRQHLEQLASVFSDKPIGGFGNEMRPYKAVVRDFRKSK